MISSALLALTFALPNTAFAQDDEASSRKSRKALEGNIIREIERGMYLKAGPGSVSFLTLRSQLTGGSLIRPVVALDIAVGQDFVDKERMSLAWELELGQALHNGPKFEELSNELAIVQGDIHTFSGIAFFEASGYLGRRFGVGIRAGGGITMAPVLMEPTKYQEEVEIPLGPRSGHSGPLPTFGGGPTIEYYTKLSHFSVGADIDVLYVLGIDLALAPAGYLKYTF